MKRHLTVVVVGAVALAAPVRAEELRTNPKLFQVERSGAVVVLEGTWRSLTAAPSLEVPLANSVRVECHRGTKTCVEHIAKLIRPSDDSSGFVKHLTLFVMKQEFRVLEWSARLIVARVEPRAADVELRISLADGTVERTSRETGARGADGANPTVVHVWRLE